MQLQAKLDAMKADFVNNADPSLLDAMGKASQQFDAPAMLSGVIKPGAQAPDFTLQNADGGQVSATDLRRQGPLLITLYRGVW